jgi:uncharacterized protein YecE (DUF72 family)
LYVAIRIGAQSPAGPQVPASDLAVARWGGMTVKVGTAGWSIPRQDAAHFPAEGSALERYAERFPVVEINSSFHRPHRTETWARWRDSVPAEFRFSAKLPKLISHQRKLVDCADPLAEFLGQVGGLGDKLGVLLLQLPPKLAFDLAVAEPFLRLLAEQSDAAIACEPRHPSWMEPHADALLAELHIARVAADPPVAGAASPGGWRGLRYWRLHGSPIIYRSSYADRIETIAGQIDEAGAAESWCIFDNTASSAAVGNALQLQKAVTTIFNMPPAC